MSYRHIVIFDGVCKFCCGSIRFIAKRDSKGMFAFTPMQSSAGQELIAQHGIEQMGMDSFVLIRNGVVHVRSDAALAIARDLDGMWWLMGVLRIVPSFVRDYFYDLLARHRYKLFGRTEQCELPSVELRSRFIGVD